MFLSVSVHKKQVNITRKLTRNDKVKKFQIWYLYEIDDSAINRNTIINNEKNMDISDCSKLFSKFTGINLSH